MDGGVGHTAWAPKGREGQNKQAWSTATWKSGLGGAVDFYSFEGKSLINCEKSDSVK